MIKIKKRLRNTKNNVSAININSLNYFFVFLLLCGEWAIAQQNTTLNIGKCFEMARQNYPLIKQYSLIEKANEYSIANAQKRYLPQIFVAGQATYQSEVTKIPISINNFDIPTINKDQYRLYGEISESITDIFTVKTQKENININSEIEAQKSEIELYKLKERIANLYFGILLIDEQMKQTELMKNDISNGIDKIKIAITNGVALKSDADKLKVEWLKADQRTIELKATRKGYADMLSLFIGDTISPNTSLEKPKKQLFTEEIHRPELTLFDLQTKSLDVQKKLINTKNLPRVNLFFQAGLGQPALNMLNPDLETYYITGIRLHWNISNFYTQKNEKKILSVSQNNVEVQRETFLFNTQLKTKQQNTGINKVLKLIETDKSIIKLRENIKKTTQNQLTYGTATINDYLTAVNAEDQAKQRLILHQIELLMTEYNNKILTGN